MDQVRLNSLECEICHIIAVERQAENDKRQLVDRKIANRDSTEIHYQGVIGEFVVAKYLNIYPDFNTHMRPGSYDLVYRGWTIDVKNRGKYEDMMAPAHKKIGESDIYIVVHGFNPYEFSGWCFDYELIKDENFITFTERDSYFLPKYRLYDMNKLFDIRSK